MNQSHTQKVTIIVFLWYVAVMMEYKMCVGMKWKSCAMIVVFSPYLDFCGTAISHVLIAEY